MLKVLKCENDWQHISGFNLFQAVRFSPQIEELHVSGTGIMKLWIAKIIIEKVTNLRIFHFDTYAFYDHKLDKVAWYYMTNGDHPQIQFSNQLKRKVESYVAKWVMRGQRHALQFFNRVHMRGEDHGNVSSDTSSDEE